MGCIVEASTAAACEPSEWLVSSSDGLQSSSAEHDCNRTPSTPF